MTRELQGLKVRALACDVPNDFHSAEIDSRDLLIYVQDSSFPELKRSWVAFSLPPGNWTIYSRADEMDLTMEMEICDEDWTDYCAANNITNQLILIP